MSKTNELKKMIKSIENLNENQVVEHLQEIMKYFLNNFELKININGLEALVHPTEIEAYYSNKNYADECVHCHNLQKTESRFGKLYIHRYKRNSGDSPCARTKNRTGMDLCLSLGDYPLTFLIRNAIINKIDNNGSHPAKLVQLLFSTIALDYKEQFSEIENQYVLQELENSNNYAPIFLEQEHISGNRIDAKLRAILTNIPKIEHQSCCS